MPPKSLVKCVECQKTESMLWRAVEQGQICQECWEKSEQHQQQQQQESSNESTKQSLEDDKTVKDIKEGDSKDTPELKAAMSEERQQRLRKSTRATRYKSKSATAVAATHQATTSNNGSNVSSAKTQNKRSRRNIFKKQPMKLPMAQATIRYTESLFYKGQYIQIGDIVSLVDEDDNVFYAQIRGLLVDSYCEKSAYLTWLIPTRESPDPKEKFDPATYLIGPDEDFSRKLCYLDFVMHAPSNYYLDRTQPFPVPDAMDIEPKKGAYTWVTLPEIERHRT